MPSPWKKSELSSHEKKTWRNFTYILLSERNQSEIATDYVIPTIAYSEEGKTMETINRSVVARDWGTKRDREVEHREFLG